MDGRRSHFIERAVHPVTDFEILFKGLEMDVRGLLLDGLIEHEIDVTDDGSRVGLGLKIRAEVTTFEEFDFGENQWDLIVLTYEPTKAIAPKVTGALKPGGVVVVEDRHLDTKRVWPAGTFGDNELLSLFKGLRVLRYEDVWARPDWGAQNLDERLVRLLAEKPIPAEPGCSWKAKPVLVGASVCWDTAVLRCRPDGWQFTQEKCIP